MNVRSLAPRNIFAFIAMSAPLLVSGVAQSQETLSVGYFDIPPHVVRVEGGVPKGAAISYFEEYIAPRLGITIKWDSESTPPTRLMNQLRNGEKDAMIFLGKTEERTEYLRYPNPYLIIPETLAFKNEHQINTIREVGDLH
ncbi:MAG: transporter substrate-binding domain-containing protein, partial [Acidobacteria bacterium]|nr:transporter substrate-binding domain-containing protein [Acidobacteriota bacterium]